MKLSAHPLWLVGFRPFFSLACVAGALLPILWALIFSGALGAPATSFSAVQWHAHEMFYGFGWAVLGGFLLTSTKNWVNIRGYHGAVLIFLACAWLVERAGMWFEGALPPLLFQISNKLFLGAIVALLVWTLVRHRKDDSYRDNTFFFIVLPLFLVAKQLMLGEGTFQTGTSMTLGLFRMAFLVMLERTVSTFMKGGFQVTLPRQPALDKAIKLLGLLLVFASQLPAPLAGAVELLLALLLAGRFVFWKPQLALRRIDIGVMYLGYLAIVAQLLLEAAATLTTVSWVGSVSVHTFTFGAMGLIIPAMLIRISNGHTGRKVKFDTLDKLVLWIMIAGFIARLVAPQFDPAGYTRWIHLSAGCWFAAFALLGWRYIPYLLRARVDGKEH